MKTREPRVKVLVRARMRTGADWTDVVIHNMSSRGLLASASPVCRPGTVVEIRRIHHIVVGRVVWQNGAYFGVRTQDPIDIQGIVTAQPPAHKPQRSDAGADDRRAVRRVPAAEREAQSRRFASAFQFVVLIVAVGAAAGAGGRIGAVAAVRGGGRGTDGQCRCDGKHHRKLIAARNRDGAAALPMFDPFP
jgi:hypothetical protein